MLRPTPGDFARGTRVLIPSCKVPTGPGEEYTLRADEVELQTHAAWLHDSKRFVFEGARNGTPVWFIGNLVGGNPKRCPAPPSRRQSPCGSKLRPITIAIPLSTRMEKVGQASFRRNSQTDPESLCRRSNTFLDRGWQSGFRRSAWFWVRSPYGSYRRRDRKLRVVA
jgi:hypothetical protein